MDLPKDIWDIVFEQFNHKELKTISFINKNATASLLQKKWKRLEVRDLSSAISLDAVLSTGLFPYAQYVNKLLICLRRNDSVLNLLWMRHLTNLKKVTLHSTEDFIKDIKIDPSIVEFLRQLFQKNVNLVEATGGCKMLEVLKSSPSISILTLCCEWTRNSFNVVSSFPNMSKLTLKKRIKQFDYYGIIPQVKELSIESSWMDQESLFKLSKVFPNITKLTIVQEFGGAPFQLSCFQRVTDLEVYHMNISRYPAELKKLKSWSTKIEFLQMIPVYTIDELHLSLYVGHVFDFLDPSFEFLPSLLLTMARLVYYSFAFEDGQSQLIISNALERYCNPYVPLKDLHIVGEDIKFAILVDDSIPAFMQHIGERMLTIMSQGGIITNNKKLTYLNFVKSMFGVAIKDAKQDAVLKDIDEYYKRINGSIPV